jgi:hypothetical protein
MASSHDKKPKIDPRGQPKDPESHRILDRAHGRYSASAAGEKGKAAPGRRTARSPARRKGASKTSVKPVGA